MVWDTGILISYGSLQHESVNAIFLILKPWFSYIFLSTAWKEPRNVEYSFLLTFPYKNAFLLLHRKHMILIHGTLLPWGEKPSSNPQQTLLKCILLRKMFITAKQTGIFYGRLKGMGPYFIHTINSNQTAQPLREHVEKTQELFFTLECKTWHSYVVTFIPPWLRGLLRALSPSYLRGHQAQGWTGSHGTE